ncbi:hypothetical protein [Nocardioides acrostichi]|uniref:Septum formation n=1 Tax=Nocardioides acrostichi TaxID=2784339 RepID=A0A930Y5X0_9ACTN|nr:hypothetical protein [Nocardioides acrostichi]MBF4160327.1 hypothetical protein [Nocardioides acrostichi]
MSSPLPSYPAQPAPRAPGEDWRGAPPPGRGAARGLAVAALVLAVLGFLVLTWVGAVVLALIVLAGSSARDRRGVGLAWTALGVCLVWVVGVTAWLAIAPPAAFLDALSTTGAGPGRGSDGQIEAEGRLSTLDLREHDCFDSAELAAESPQIVQVDAKPCSDLHQFEVAAVVRIGTKDFPGTNRVQRMATRKCVPHLRRLDSSRSLTLDMLWTIAPTADSWTRFEDRTALCVVGDPAHPSTGSVRDGDSSGPTTGV